MSSCMIIIKPLKVFSRGVEFGVDTGDVSDTGIGSCIISVIFNSTVFILMQNINHINVNRPKIESCGTLCSIIVRLLKRSLILVCCVRFLILEKNIKETTTSSETRKFSRPFLVLSPNKVNKDYKKLRNSKHFCKVLWNRKSWIRVTTTQKFRGKPKFTLLLTPLFNWDLLINTHKFHINELCK